MMQTNTSEKNERLTARYKDKSIARSERQQAMEELKGEKYRTDPRPSMSLKSSSCPVEEIFIFEEE